jgi:Flp pilus assembly protein CpaB
MRRGRILILLGLILALGTAAVVFILLQSTAPTGEPEIERVDVVYAMQPIAEGSPVDMEGQLGIKKVPKEGLSESVVRDLQETQGMLAAVQIQQGDVIYANMLQTPEEQMQKAKLGKLVEVGFVAVAFPISELSSVSYGIQPGDHVDILITFPFIDIDQETQIREPLCPPICPVPGGAEGESQEVSGSDQRPRLATQLTVQNAEVLGVGRWNYKETAVQEQQAQGRNQEAAPPPEKPPEYITLMLQPQDALVLKLAREYKASIDLAVRAEDDAQPFATQQVTLDYILTRFGVSLPPRQPYTIEQLGNTVQPAGSE